MSIQSEIEQQLKAAFEPIFLSVENDSHLHAGPATESHFKVTLVVDDFKGQTLLTRQRSVYRVLNKIMPTIHALQLHTYTSEEWHEKRQEIAVSSTCAGSKKQT